MKNKRLPSCLQGNYGDSLGEFCNTSYGVVGAERVNQEKNVKNRKKRNVKRIKRKLVEDLEGRTDLQPKVDRQNTNQCTHLARKEFSPSPTPSAPLPFSSSPFKTTDMYTTHRSL